MTNLEYLSLRDLISNKFSRRIILQSSVRQNTFLFGIIFCLMAYVNAEAASLWLILLFGAVISFIWTLFFHISVEAVKEVESRVLKLISEAYERQESVDEVLKSTGPVFQELKRFDNPKKKSGVPIGH